MKCVLCEGDLQSQHVDVWIKRGDRWALARNVPALICDDCGDQSYDQATAERLALISDVHAYPVAPTALEVFAVFDFAEPAQRIAAIPMPIAQALTGTSIEHHPETVFGQVETDPALIPTAHEA